MSVCGCVFLVTAMWNLHDTAIHVSGLSVCGSICQHFCLEGTINPMFLTLTLEQANICSEDPAGSAWGLAWVAEVPAFSSED